MKVAIIDAELIGRKNHRFPNLVCMKISSYWKKLGAEVVLKTDYNNLEKYDNVYISKVFTDTPIPEDIKETEKIKLGGTGFYFDKAPNLPMEIEHIKPDYNLYNEWIEMEVERLKKLAIAKGKKVNEKTIRNKFKEYTDSSIGFLTRGCFRKCKFCVNQKYDKVLEHSQLEEFLDSKRKIICLLDDNFLGCPNWSKKLDELKATGKRIKFKQGLDERLLDEEKCKKLFNLKYDGEIFFAFDNIKDYDLIKGKLELIKKHRKGKRITFYVLVGFESVDAADIENAFKRIELLTRYSCMPYIMRYRGKDYAPYEKSELKGMYITLASWCNQPHIFKNMTFREYCLANQERKKDKSKKCTALKAMTEFEAKYPQIAKKYFDIKFGKGLKK